MGRLCPWCGRAIPRGTVHQCPRRPRRPDSRDARKAELRRSSETWRKGYDSDYQRARDGLIRASEGRCEACGAIVYARTARGWRKAARDFGGTHHLVPLSKGGSNSRSNLAVLCARCHGAAHSKAFADAAEALGADVPKGALLSLVRRIAS